MSLSCRDCVDWRLLGSDDVRILMKGIFISSDIVISLFHLQEDEAVTGQETRMHLRQGHKHFH